MIDDTMMGLPVNEDGMVDGSVMDTDGFGVAMGQASMQYQQQEDRNQQLATLHAVWLYDDEEDAKTRVDSDGRYFMYGTPSMRNSDANLFVYGRDYARVVAPDAADEPLSLCERYVDAMPDGERKTQRRRELDALMSSGKDRKDDYYGMLGGFVRDDVRGGYRQWQEDCQRQQELQERNAARFDELLQLGLDGKAVDFSPEDVEILRMGGVSLEDMYLAAAAMRSARKWMDFRHDHGNPNAEDALIELALIEENCPNANIIPLVMARVAADSERMSSALEESGFGEKALAVAGDVVQSAGDVVWNAMSSLMPGRGQTVRATVSSYEQVAVQIDKAERDGALSHEEAQRRRNELERRYQRGQVLRGGLMQAMEEGESATRERYGFTGLSATKTIADLGMMLLEYMPITTGGTVAAGVQDKAAKYAYLDPEGNAVEHQSRALAYSGAEYAAFRWAPKVVWSGSGKLFGATVGKTAFGKATTRGFDSMNRSAFGAASLGAARGVGDVGVIIPGATGTLHALYDVIPGTDDELDSGLQELGGLWSQLGTGGYWAETLVAGGAFGVMNVPGWYRGQRLVKSRAKETYEALGGDPAFFEKHQGVSAQALPGLLNGELQRERAEDPGAMIRRAIGHARRQLGEVQERTDRGDKAVLAMLQMRGFDVVPEGGKYRLYFGGEVKDGKAVRGGKSVLLDEADLDAFIGMQMDGEARVAAHLMRGAAASGRMVDAFKDLGVDVEWMRADFDGRAVEEAAVRARDRVQVRTRELMDEKGVDEASARREAESEVHEDILDGNTARWLSGPKGEAPGLGAVVSYGEQWANRRMQAEAAGHTGRMGSRANVRAFKNPDGTEKRVLRLVHGASPKEVAEELGEQAAIRFMRTKGMNVIQAFRVLDALREWMAGHSNKEISSVADTFLTLHKNHGDLYKRVMSETFDVTDIDSLTPSEDKLIRSEVVEGLSRLMFSDLMRDQLRGNPEMPGWARALGEDLTLDLAEAKQQLSLANALSEARAEGWLPEAVSKTWNVSRDRAMELISRGAEEVRAALRGKAEPEPGEYLDALYRQEKAQAELDALFGSDVAVAPEKFDAFEQEAREGQEKLDEARAEAEQELADKAAEDVAETQADNPGMTHEEAVKATNGKKNKNRQEQIETAVDAEHDPDFEGGVCQTVADPQGGAMCKLGFLSIAKLKVLPNFKLGADTETGVVEPLKGDYRADHDPIRVWRRADGTLEVISGRHRLDAAKRAGMDKISAFVYEESEVHDEQWARRFDIESNIRDNQATALEVALYVRGEWHDGRALTDEEIDRAGIARKGKAGSIGCEIARKGTLAVIDAWRNGALTEQQAFWIASFMPFNERAQNAGVKMATSGDVTKGEILTTMEAAHAIAEMGGEMGVRREVDLWGNEIGFGDEFEQFVGKYVTRKRNEIGKDLAYIGATATKRNAAEMAKKYGVDIKDPGAMKRKQEELQRLKERWKNPYTDHELMEEIREAYRKETMEGWAEGEGAKGAVEGEEAPAELPGEAEGQGTLFAREPASLRIWNARLHDLRKGQGSVAGERTEAHYSVVAQKEVQGLRKCVEGVLGKERKGEIYNPNVGNMTLEWGKVVDKKAVGAGVMHITEHRLFQGLTLNEIGRVIAYALKAAETVVPKKTRGVRLMFERFGVKAVAAINEKQGNPIITGFVLGTQGKKEAVDSVAALATERFYALDELDRIQEVGAALRDGIAHFEEIVKNNPHNWEQIVSAEVEMLKIKQNAKHDGTFMKAPNGKPTKLTETQWTQVRTKAFKGWFGDWENDPENASKVVDENGEPRVVYHGTWEDFTVFKRGLLGGGDVSPARSYIGHWFSNEKMTGVKKHMGVFLDIKNPQETSSLWTLDEYVSNEYYGNAKSTLKKLGSSYARDMRESGIDGIIVSYDHELNETSYVVLDSTQIKSATDNRGTFDAGNADITFSVASGEGRELLRRNGGKLEAGNGVLYDMGSVSFSTFARHASPHSGIRKFLMEFIGTGEGNLTFGWGMYFSTLLGTHESYKRQFSKEGKPASEYEVELDVDGYDDPRLLQWDDEIDPRWLEAYNAEFGNEDGHSPRRGKGFYRMLVDATGSKMAASKWLLGHGVKGISYVDGASRRSKLLGGLGDVTYNYVMFSADDIRITRYNDAGQGWVSMPEVSFSVMERADNTRYVRVDNPVYREKEARDILTRKKNEMTYIGKKGRVFGKRGYGLVAPGTDYEVFIMQSSIESILSGKHVRGSISPDVHYAAASVLDELWLSSRFLQDHDDTKGKPGRDIKQMHRRMAEMHLDGKVYEVKLTAKEYSTDNDTNTLYMLKVESIKEKSAKASEEAAGNPGESSPIADRGMVADGERVVKRGGEKQESETQFSIFGMTARGASVADEKGETYVDPADGKKKWVVSDAVSRLRDNFTFGQLNVAAGGHKDTTLGAVLHFPALFENYPELEKVRVRFYKPRENDGCGGYLNPYAGPGVAAYIAVNMGARRTPGRVLEVLRHESQHWVQNKEGHAVGSGVETAEDALNYLDVAISQREKAGVDDDWSRENLDFLKSLRKLVEGGDERAIAATYMYSRGEQEARFTGEGLGVEGTAGLEHRQLQGCGLLRKGTGNGTGDRAKAADYEHGPRKPVCIRHLGGSRAGRRHNHQHGWESAVGGQRTHGTLPAHLQVRTILPDGGRDDE